jgi:hypothetical protein
VLTPKTTPPHDARRHAADPSSDGSAASAVAPPGEPTRDPAATAGGSDAPSFAERSLPAQVSAAWELELLIAGAVTFALLQLPGELEAGRAWLTSVIGGSRAGLTVAMMGAVYAKAALYTLILAFIVNLAARAYWVGLVGLHSVYPQGPRWDQLRMGPIFTETYRRQIPSLPTLIARVDNFASVVFSFGFLVVVWVAFSVAGVALFAAIAVGIARLLTGGRYVFPIAVALGTLLLMPSVIASYVDKHRADRMGPVWRRRITSIARVSTRTNGAALFGPIMFTLMSNAGRRRIMTLAFAALIGSLALSMGERFVRDGIFGVSRASFAPDDPDLQGVHAEHYESLVPARLGDRVITIQSDVITDPYVRLFVPFRDERHALALRDCPAAAPVAAAPARGRTAAAAARVLGCLTALHAVTIDGVRVPDPGFRFYTHPGSGVNGIVAHLPTAALAPGMHTLVVQPPPMREDRRDRPNPPTEIPFWR